MAADLVSRHSDEHCPEVCRGAVPRVIQHVHTAAHHKRRLMGKTTKKTMKQKTPKQNTATHNTQQPKQAVTLPRQWRVLQCVE